MFGPASNRVTPPFKAYEAVVAYEAVPNKEPVNEPVKDPVADKVVPLYVNTGTPPKALLLLYWI
jgi:hypothetical protein